jgi:hypothetical protein
VIGSRTHRQHCDLISLLSFLKKIRSAKRRSMVLSCRCICLHCLLSTDLQNLIKLGMNYIFVTTDLPTFVFTAAFIGTLLV